MDKRHGYLAEIEIDRIDTSQNHRSLDKNSVEFLALRESIEQQGLLQPPVVTLQDSEEKPFLCVAGHRRLEALKDLKTTHVTCTVLDVTELAHIQAARLAENIIREDLKPLDLATALKSLKMSLNVSSKGLARILNKDRAYLARILRIADWPQDVQSLARDHNLNIRRLFMLAARNLPDHELRQALREIIENRDAGRKPSKAQENLTALHAKRDAYFNREAVPDVSRIWILRFLRDNRIAGWFEDIPFDTGE